jgi:peptidoglycan-associated lipoprotein
MAGRVPQRDKEGDKGMKIRTAGVLLAMGLLVAGCGGRGGPAAGEGMGGFGPGYAGGGLGGGLDGGGFGAGGPGAIGATTLPGTSISDRVFFAVDQYSLSPEAIATLTQQVEWLRRNPSLPINIEGHADERGTREYNIGLSARRAASVRNFMVANGIPDARISTTPYGRERPVATCPNESCWSQNRRAVTVVTGGAGV